jgi:hypothetical protein
MALFFTGMIQGTTATVAAAGTSVSPVNEIPDNCHTVVIYNESGAQTIYVGVGTAGPALPAATSVHIPKETSLTLSVGAKSVRANPGFLVYDCNAASAVARITYVCGISS